MKNIVKTEIRILISVFVENKICMQFTFMNKLENKCFSFSKICFFFKDARNV